MCLFCVKCLQEKKPADAEGDEVPSQLDCSDIWMTVISGLYGTKTEKFDLWEIIYSCFAVKNITDCPAFVSLQLRSFEIKTRKINLSIKEFIFDWTFMDVKILLLH